MIFRFIWAIEHSSMMSRSRDRCFPGFVIWAICCPDSTGPISKCILTWIVHLEKKWPLGTLWVKLIIKIWGCERFYGMLVSQWSNILDLYIDIEGRIYLIALYCRCRINKHVVAVELVRKVGVWHFWMFAILTCGNNLTCIGMQHSPPGGMCTHRTWKKENKINQIPRNDLNLEVKTSLLLITFRF